MSAATPRRRKETRPAELLDAALDVFAERGFAAARMEDIAARAGAAKGTVYLYFASKEAVFEALVRRAIVPNIERAEVMATAHDGSAAALLRRLISTFAAVIALDSRIVVLPRLMIGELYRFPELARFYKAAVLDRGLGLIATVHRRGVERGEFRPQDSDAVAKLVVAPVLLTAILKTVFAPHADEPFDPAPILEAHAETLLRGLAAGGPGEGESR